MRNRDIVSIRDLSKEDIELILKEAQSMEELLKNNREIDILRNKIIALLFFEPSTRTRLSFEFAAKKLGANVLIVHEAKSLSIAKGESFIDTIKTIENYCDCIVIRHPRDGAAKLAAEISEKPVINAGDGSNQHPTQTLLDLYTIVREKGTLKLNIGILGDLKYARTARSLIYALAKFNANIYLIFPKELPPHREILEYLEENGVKYFLSNSIEEVIDELDVLYVTRIQKERFADIEEYERVRGSYKVTMDLIKKAKEDIIILHPLPRVDEIEYEIDRTKHAKYFKQVFYGLPVRMAIFKLILKG